MTESPRAHSVAAEAALLAEALSSLSARVRPPSAEAPQHTEPGPQSGPPSAQVGPGGEPGCSQCGCAMPSLCAACPVCRAAGALHRVRPETLQRLADVAGAVAEILRAAAAASRQQEHPNEAQRVRVEDVPVSVAGEEPQGCSSEPIDLTGPPQDPLFDLDDPVVTDSPGPLTDSSRSSTHQRSASAQPGPDVPDDRGDTTGGNP